jgi:hypothetical protein
MRKVLGITSCGGCGLKLWTPNVLAYDKELSDHLWQCSECGYKSFYGSSCFDFFEPPEVGGYAWIVKAEGVSIPNRNSGRASLLPSRRY